jgi:hypothetical protein
VIYNIMYDVMHSNQLLNRYHIVYEQSKVCVIQDMMFVLLTYGVIYLFLLLLYIVILYYTHLPSYVLISYPFPLFPMIL